MKAVWRISYRGLAACLITAAGMGMPACAAEQAAGKVGFQDLSQAAPLGRQFYRGVRIVHVPRGAGIQPSFAVRVRPASFAYRAYAAPRRYVPVQGYGYGGGRWGRGGGRGGFQAPDAAANALRRQGYSNVDPLQRRGRSYVGEATGPQGQRQRVIIDGRSGRVMGVSPSGPPAAMPPPGGGWYGGY
jgi:hypothetical protein